ncbi:MAG: hypothetical protein IVW51_07665 [Thermaceae bacterium]|nr:hypothetical protein [Thermaceae bacterium]
MKRLTLLFLLLALLPGVSFAAGSKVVLRSNTFLKINDAYLLYSYPTAPYLHGGRMMASLNSLADMARLEPKYSPGCAQATLTSVNRIVTLYGVDSDPGRPPTLETWLLLASEP